MALPPELFEYVMLRVDRETLLNYCRQYPNDNICAEGNDSFWREKFYRDRGNLRLPLMNSLSWRELYYARVYEFSCYVSYLPPSYDDLIEPDSYIYQPNYLLSDEEMIINYNYLKDMLSDIVKVFDVAFNQTDKRILFYIVPNDILDPSEQIEFNEAKFHEAIFAISEVPFRQEPLTQQMIEEFGDEDLVDDVLQGPQWQIHII